jgi:D-3-phosphoglycerate dehydrogenase
MRPEAFVVNISRGPIIEQGALTDALREGRLAGAALDVFEKEPIAPDDPLLELDNVILAPHGIGMSDEILLNTGRSACNSVLAVAAGRVPANLLNPTALDHPRLAGRLQA